MLSTGQAFRRAQQLEVERDRLLAAAALLKDGQQRRDLEAEAEHVDALRRRMLAAAAESES